MTPPRDDGDALLAAFADRLGALVLIERLVTPWVSATFAGARHRLSVQVAPDADLAAFCDAIAEADIPLRRGFVADVAVVDHATTETGQQLTIEALVIDAD